MKNILRITFIFLIIIFIGIVAALGVGIYKPQVYEGLLNKIVYSKTGYQFSTKDIELQRSPTKLIVQGFVLENPQWTPDPELLLVQNMEVSFNLKRLFKNSFPFWHATFSNAEIKWREDENELNWNTPLLANRKKSEDQTPLDIKSLLSFSEINLIQSKLNHQRKDISETIDITSLILNRESENSVILSGKGVIQKQQVELDGAIEIVGDEPIEQTLDFDLQARGLGIDLHSNGLFNPSDIDRTKVSFKANSKDLSQIERFLETTFPALAPVDVSLEFKVSDDRYEFSKIDLKLGDSQLLGDLLFDHKDSFVHVNLNSSQVDLSPFVNTNNDQATPEQNEKNDTELDNEEEEIDWSWIHSLNAEINLDVGKIIFHQHQLREFQSKLKIVDGIIDIPFIKTHVEYNEIDQPTRSISTDLIEVSGQLSPLAEKTHGEDLQLNLEIKDSGARLAFNGKTNINGFSGNIFAIEAQATQLDALEKYLQTDISGYLPADVGVNIEFTDHSLAINQLVASFNESDLTADINMDWTNKIVNVEGNANSKLLDLTPLISKSKKDEQSVNNNSENKKIFSEESINWDWLTSFKVDVALSIEKLIADKNVFNDLKASAKLSEGELLVAPLKAYFADGHVNSVLKLKKVNSSAALDVKLDALNLSLADLGATGDSVLEGGTTDVVLNLSGTGQSLHQIMSSINGEVVAEVQEGVIKNDSFEMIGTDVLFELLSTLNPFMKEDETTKLECAAVKFSAQDGVLTSRNQIALETSKIKIVGGGIINLDTEELEVGFSPSAKKGIGVNVSSLVKFVRLGGTLRNPHPEADPVGLLKSGAAIGAAVSTGGLSLLVEGLFKRAANSGSACNQALSDNPELNSDDSLSQPDAKIEESSNSK